MTNHNKGPDWFDWIAIGSVWILIIVFIMSLWASAGSALQCPR